MRFRKIVVFGIVISCILCTIIFGERPKKISSIYSRHNSSRRIRGENVEIELRKWLGEYTDRFLKESRINRFSKKDKELILFNLIKLFGSNFEKLRTYFLEVSESLPLEMRRTDTEIEKMAKEYIRDRIAFSLKDIIASKDFIMEDEVVELLLFLKAGVRLDKETQTSLVFGGLDVFDATISDFHNPAELEKGLKAVIDLAKESKEMANMTIVILRTILEYFYYDVDEFIENSRFSLEIIDGFEEMGRRYYRPLICAISLLYPFSVIDTMEKFKSSSLLLKELYTILSQKRIDDEIEILKLHNDEDETNPYYEFRAVFKDNSVSAIFIGLVDSIDTIEKFEQVIKGAIEIAKQGEDPTPYLKSFITRD